MKRKKVALYDPYLDTLGGGEKHILQILQALEDEGYELHIFWDKDLTNDIKSRFSFHFANQLNFLPNIFHQKNSLLKKLKILNGFDLFFYITDGSYFISTAKKNFVFCMVPKKGLYQMSIINKIKTHNCKFLANSKYTKNWLNKWGIHSEVIYPYLPDEFINLPISNVNKDKIILSVGRFFKHIHAKRQDLIINLFKQFRQKNNLFKEFKLILAGGLKEEDKQYYLELKNLSQADPSIILKPNISYHELFELYKKSLIYWHFTGFGINENEHPELAEHLGISPLEAMAYGCITFCYNAGGPKEIINNCETGFLFDSENDLINKMRLVLSNKDLQEKIQKQAKEYVVKNFNYEVFKNKVKEVIL